MIEMKTFFSTFHSKMFLWMKKNKIKNLFHVTIIYNDAIDDDDDELWMIRWWATIQWLDLNDGSWTLHDQSNLVFFLVVFVVVQCINNNNDNDNAAYTQSPSSNHHYQVFKFNQIIVYWWQWWWLWLWSS